MSDFVFTHILSSLFCDDSILVFATVDHPDSSYGKPVWVDGNNVAYCNVGQEFPFYNVESLIADNFDVL